MKYIKKFEKFLASPEVKPDVAPPPVKPQRPVKPSKPITRPAVDPDPKAEKKKKVTELDVANRFIQEINDKGESVIKYLNK